jgi:hypothetical protein
MRQSGFRAWKVFGGLAAAALLSVGCGYLPETGGHRPDDPPRDFFGGRVGGLTEADYDKHQYPSDRGYNGTIQQVGSSIDPRTPEAAGTLGNSRLVDVTGRPAPAEPELGIGGSGGVGEVGEPDSSTDRGWRARRGYDVSGTNIGSFGGAPLKRQIPGP